jgi:PIN domain nuclease of toxin-antitoxin system
MNAGKLPPHALATDFLNVARKNNFIFIEIHPLHAIRSALLPFHHRDPFDRLLAAQSLELSAPLLSNDSIFDRYGVTRIW